LNEDASDGVKEGVDDDDKERKRKKKRKQEL